MRASQTPILIIESGEITLNNPVRSGYTFVSWTGTELTEPALVVNIPAGSTGEREYTAVREKENSGETTDDEDIPPESSSPSDNGSQPPSYNNPSTSDEDNSVSSESAPTDNDYKPIYGQRNIAYSVDGNYCYSGGGGEA